MDEITENTEYRFERLQPKHYKDLVYISKSAFNIDPGIAYFINKNKTDAFGATNLGYIAYHKESNQPAAFYGVYAHPYVYQGRQYYVVQSGDTMTHSSHFGKSLFSQLAKLTYRLAAGNGAKMVYGFPNKKSYPVLLNKLNFQFKGNLNVYKIRIYTFPLLKISKKVKFLKPIYNLYLYIINKLLIKHSDIFENTIISTNYGGIPHNSKFFNYKKFNGSYILHQGNLKCWIKPDGFLYIGDIEKSSLITTTEIIKKIKVYAFLIGADIVTFRFSPATYWDNQFSKYLKPEKGAEFGYLLFDEDFPIEAFQVCEADLDTF
ncbi:MAG: hypothetical protein V9G42_13005 [Bacteroidia bacterium]